MATRLLLVLAFALAVGCRETASYQAMPMPPEGTETSRPDVSRIYVMRASQGYGKVRSLRVEEHDKEIGALGQGEFLCWERAPGRSLLRLWYEGPRVEGSDLEGLHSLDAEPGRVHYLMIHLDTNPDTLDAGVRAGHPKVEVLDDATGRKEVASRRPVPVKAGAANY